MKYLNCEHCKHQNPLKTEFLIFCEHCGHKFANPFQSWKNTNPSNTFEDYIHLFGAEKENEAVLPQKRGKSYWIKLFAIYILLSVSGGVLVDYFLNYKGSDEQKLPVELVEKDWEVYRLGGIFTFETPFALSATTPGPKPEASNALVILEDVRSNSHLPLEIFAGHYVATTNPGKISLAWAAKMAVSELANSHGAEGVKYNEKQIRKGKVGGLLLKGTFKQENKDMEFQAYVFTKGSALWQLTVLYPSGDENARKAAERIGASISIEENTLV